MISIETLQKSYPEKLRIHKRSILREYIQCKILNTIYNSNYANDLIFLGGTALRIVHNNQRFSEDLDFDNLCLKEQDFVSLSELILKDLSLIGYECEVKVVKGNALHIYIKIPEVLYKQGLTPIKNEKITIQIDALAQDIEFKPELFLLDKFDIYTKIKVTPLDIILSQKLHAVFNRKRLKGRDFFDIDYIINNLKCKPNIEYLDKKLGIKTYSSLRNRLFERIDGVDFEVLGKDVEKFLFNKETVSRVLNFKQSMKSWDL